MLYWNQDTSPEAIPAPDDVADILFAVDCRRLPVDHAHALSQSLARALPWIADEPLLAVQPIHLAGSQNGWERPAHGTDNYLQISRRTRLTIRSPAHRIDALLANLPGTRIEVDGHPLQVGAGKVRPLSRETTLFARFVVAAPAEEEDTFLSQAAQALGEMGIRVRKALCGKSTPLATPLGPIQTRGLLIADLSVEESFLLQRLGLGPNRYMGCGVFIPHKGVDAVSKGR